MNKRAELLERHEEYNVYQYGKWKVYTVGKPDIRKVPEDVLRPLYLSLGEGARKWKLEQEAANEP